MWQNCLTVRFQWYFMLFSLLMPIFSVQAGNVENVCGGPVLSDVDGTVCL